MFTRMLRLACAASMLVVIGACDGGSLTGPDDAAESPQTRTACMAGGDVAILAGCPNAEEESGTTGDLGPVDQGFDDCGPTFGASISKLNRC